MQLPLFDTTCYVPDRFAVYPNGKRTLECRVEPVDLFTPLDRCNCRRY